MAIKVARKIKHIEEKVKNEPKKTEKTSGEKLPPDEYTDEVPPKEIIIDENGKIIISVKRGGDYGLPFVDIRYYATTERFTGFTKKGVSIPLEDLYELRAEINDVLDECEEKGLFE